MEKEKKPVYKKWWFWAIVIIVLLKRKQKTYYENNCKEIDQKTYKSCNVVLDNKKIIITSEIDLNSEVAKEYLATVLLNDVKENYADTPYTCK